MSDNDDIPFNRDFALKPGVTDEVRPAVRRVLCNNPSPFTFTGTVSYIVGRGNVAIIDPGPDNEAHASALLDADDCELTRTRKVRRSVINEKYATIIDAIYGGERNIPIDTVIRFQDGTTQRIRTTLAVVDLARDAPLAEAAE